MRTTVTTTKHPTSSATTLPIPRTNSAADRLLRWARSGAYRTPGSQRLQLINVPNKAERAILKARWIEVRDHMHKLDKQIVVAALIDLFGCYRNGLKGSEDARTVAMKYLSEMAGLPTWAIVRACAQIRAGTFGEHTTYPPSTIALKQIAQSYCAVPLTEMHQIAEVLQGESAPEAVSDAEGARVASLLRDLATTLRATPSPSPAVINRDARPHRPWAGEVSPELAALIQAESKEQPS
jgi:hypothetical protein